MLMFAESIDGQYRGVIAWLRLIKLFLSYIALMIFAWQLFDIIHLRFKQFGRSLIGIALLGYFGSVLLKWHFEPMSEVVYFDVAHAIRLWIGFGGASLAGIGLIIYGHMLKQQTKAYGSYFIGSGLGLLVYGVLSGVVHTDWHHSVPVMRTLAATVILVCLYQALRVFDIEKERATEAKLKRALEAEKYNAIGQLAMGVAHEVNNPLASATLALDLLSRQSPNESQQEYIQRVRLGINRAASISKELLNYARPAKEEAAKLYLRQVIEAAIVLLAHKAKAYPITLICSPNVTLVGQKIKLEELFINLLANAIDASQPGQEIRLIVTESESELQIQVIDTGTGMDEVSLARAMEPFFSTKVVGEGTGLGLAICDKIVKLHSGHMSIESMPGHGTQVLIRLPKEAN